MFSKKEIKDELSKKGLKERFSSDNISNGWKTVRNISATVFTISSLLAAAPVSLPVALSSWLGYIVLVSGTIAGRAQLNKSKK